MFGEKAFSQSDIVWHEANALWGKQNISDGEE